MHQIGHILPVDLDAAIKPTDILSTRYQRVQYIYPSGYPEGQGQGQGNGKESREFSDGDSVSQKR